MATITTQPSQNEAKFTEVVKSLLAENYTHHDLKQKLYHLVMEEAQKLPPIRVVICTSYGGFGFSEVFTTFVHSHTNLEIIDLGRDSESSLRSDPVLIQGFSDYGRSICNKYPFILNDMRTVYTWRLDKLFTHLKLFHIKETEFEPELVAEATSFAEQMSDSRGRWKDSFKGFLNDSERSDDLESFAEKHPDFWMFHSSMTKEFRGTPMALRFAHVLLQEGDRGARYRVEPDEAQDAAIYERIGLCGASSNLAKLAIKEIPALVDFSIQVYDGLESVECRCDGGKKILEDVEYVMNMH